MELNMEQLEKVSGGVLDDTARDYIQNYIAAYKDQGSGKEILDTTGWTKEYMDYALSVWDSIKA